MCGKKWEELNGQVAACPIEWPFGTKFNLLGVEWTCVDRGGAIAYVDGIPWVDLMSDTTLISYGTILEAELILP